MSKPYDAEAMLSDDALLDALAAGAALDDFADDPTAALLASWRSDLLPSDAELIALAADDSSVTVTLAAGDDLPSPPAEQTVSVRDLHPAAADDLTVSIARDEHETVSVEQETVLIARDEHETVTVADAADRTITLPDDQQRTVNLDLVAASAGSDPDDGKVTMLRRRRPAGDAENGPGWRSSRRVAVAVVATVIGATSLGGVAAAATAKPGDALWPVSKVVYHDRAQSLEAKEKAKSKLRRAREAAETGRVDRAAELLKDADSDAGKVRSADGGQALRDEVSQLKEQVQAIAPDGTPTQPGTTGPVPSANPSASPGPVNPGPADPSPQPSPDTPTQPADPPTTDPTQPEEPPPSPVASDPPGVAENGTP